jgi:hypothetical protein
MNGTRDIVFKRCGCTDEATGRQLAGSCPHLADAAHGSWYYAVQVTTVGGRKARYRRGGFVTREAAIAARQAVLDGPADQAAAGPWTVARHLAAGSRRHEGQGDNLRLRRFQSTSPRSPRPRSC